MRSPAASGYLRCVDLRWVRGIGYLVGAAAGSTAAAVGLLLGQAEQARRAIPRAESPPPRSDRVYGARYGGRPLTVVMMGDSVAAGYGAAKPRETPGALLATGVSRRLRRPVQLHRVAVVGATSDRLAPQVEEARELGADLAVIVVGGNDITHHTRHTSAVEHLVAAVTQLREAGTEVVVGSCPDLGTIRPIRPPLRWLARRWSRQLAAAQTVAVVEAGGWTVSLGDLLGPRFAAEPQRMFGYDSFHPSPEGYAAATAAMLPTALAALGAPGPADTATETGVQSLPQAAAAASRHAGVEVSGATVAGRERGPAGRWAALRRRVRAAAKPPPPTDASEPEHLEPS